MQGYIQVYTGNGKGKTTAALGLAVRAASAGLDVYFIQFVKGGNANALRSLNSKFSNIQMSNYGRHKFVNFNPEKKDKEIAQKGWKKIEKIVPSEKYDVIIMDEINIAIYYELIPEENVLEVLENKPNDIELILTGRYASDKIIQKADLVTEMKPLKHYFNQGVSAREGIEY